MANPLDRTPQDAPMQPGDVRHVNRKDAPPITIIRTDRPYVDDLCDAYNAARTSLDVEWFVTKTGELALRHAR